MTKVVFRDLHGMDEFNAAVDLQYAVWGADDMADPGDLMMVIQHEGGLVGGAFLGNELVGYVFGFATRETHVQHSHRLAVHAKMRGQGLALKLKQYQRSWCLARGITHVRWTFDPQRHTNAHLNVGRLGVSCSTYFTDYYGEMKGINAGVPSDRLLADWHLRSDRAVALAEGREPVPLPVAATVTIGKDFERQLTEDVAAATAERLRVRAELQAHFADGLAITGYDAAGGRYLLSTLKTA